MMICAACGLRFDPRARGQRVCCVKCAAWLAHGAAPERPQARAPAAPGAIGDALRETRASVARMLARARAA